MLFYNFPDAYDLFFTESFRDSTQRFYEKIFGHKNINNVLDCTVGTGQMTIPWAKMGYNVIGSDINKNMLRKARTNFAKYDLTPQLVRSDILNLSKNIKREFDLVAATGNSLAHIKKNNLKNALNEMDSLIKPGGTIYLDSRNWDLVLERRQRFYLFNPIVRDKGRINYIQVWDYNKDDSMTFNFLIFEEIENKIISKRQFYVIYYPFETEYLINLVESMGYENISIFKLGDPEVDVLNNIDWFSLMATKPYETSKKKKKKKSLFK